MCPPIDLLLKTFRNQLEVYCKYEEYYPRQFLTFTQREDLVYVKHYEDPSVDFTSLHADYFINHRQPNRNHEDNIRSDIHEKRLQDFALTTTRNWNSMDFKQNKIYPFGHEFLVRARNFAIGSRNDLDWNGQPLEDPEVKKRKQKEMEEYHLSTVLYDWYQPEAETVRQNLFANPSNTTTKVAIQNSDSLDVVIELTKQHPTAKIAWLNLANAHHIGGAYNRHFGSQEEFTITRCTAVVSLSIHAEGNLGTLQGLKEWKEQHAFSIKAINYRKHHHIPPGGAYFSKTRLLSINEEVDCYMIANASADMRRPSDKTPESEGSSIAIGSEEYKLRILLDLEAICLTAIHNNIDYLVLAATGCGCFNHPPELEAQLWGITLNKYSKYFKGTYFAVLDSTNGRNITAFEQIGEFI